MTNNNNDMKNISLTVKEAAIESEFGNLAKGTFIAGLDHKLRTPMNSIMGMLNLLKETELSNHQEGYVNSALEASKFLLKIINSVTDFPINSYKLELETKPFDLFKAGKNVIKAFSGSAASKAITLQYEYEANTPTLLNGDSVKIQQVLAKLLENALFFTEKGAVKITIKQISEKNDIHTIEIKIIDSGTPLEKEEIENIFEFTSPVFAQSPKMRRISLELAVCKKIINSMGGEIVVEQNQEKGNTFKINIPLKETPTEVINQISSEHEKNINKNEDAFKSYKGLKVLLAEDDPINQSLAVAFLSKLGANVITADTGKEALDQFKETDFDIIFMDCEMPVMDGFDASREIRKIEKETKRKTPIIAMTAYAARGDKENCIAAGMDAHVPKPITVNVLQDIVEKYIFRNEQ